MHHFTREPRLSIVDTIGELQASARAPIHPGINEATVVVPDPNEPTGILSAIEHVLERDATETERDFMAMVLAEARRLGARSVKIGGILAVPEEN